jgi:hypothetical protein
MTRQQPDSMLAVSRRTLKILAAVVWYTGGIMLVRKAIILLLEVQSLRPGSGWIVFAVAVGITVGVVKAALIFRKSCRKNLARIDALETPRVWMFFRPWFFFFLFLMIGSGVTSSKMAHGNFPFLIGVATLDLTIATALLSSSVVFWKQRFLVRV